MKLFAVAVALLCCVLQAQVNPDQLAASENLHALAGSTKLHSQTVSVSATEIRCRLRALAQAKPDLRRWIQDLPKSSR
jgi:hypothetical protein